MGLIGDVGGYFAGRKAAGRQRELSRQYNDELSKYQKQFGALSADFGAQFKNLSDNFDPYDLQNEFDSMYEAVIMPMERQFSESILPSIRQSYSGGGYGSGLFSGGRESAEAQARSNLSMNEALLKNQARGAGIQRNFQDYDRRKGDLGTQYGMGKEPIALGIELAGKGYGASGDAIAATLAADSAGYNALGSVVDTAVGFMAGGPIGAGIMSGGAGPAGGNLMGYTQGSSGFQPNASSGGFQTWNAQAVNPQLYGNR